MPKYGLVILAGGVEFTVEAGNTDPINDNTPPVKQPAPPGAQPPAKVPPPGSGPDKEDDEDQDDTTPSKGPSDLRPPGDNATEDDLNDGYVGGAKVQPAKIPNPESGGLAPNPDNATMSPKVGIKENADSLDDDSAKPDVNDLNWFMGSTGLAYKVDPETGLASWPLQFKTIEKDTKRPNKPGAADQDVAKTGEKPDGSEDDYARNKPYAI